MLLTRHAAVEEDPRRISLFSSGVQTLDTEEKFKKEMNIVKLSVCFSFYLPNRFWAERTNYFNLEFSQRSPFVFPFSLAFRGTKLFLS